MKKTLISLLIIMSLAFSMSIVIAKPNFVQAANPAGKTFYFPENAVEVSPGVYYLGEIFDNGRFAEGYAFLLKEKKAFAKPGSVCGNGICEPGENINKCPQDCSGEPIPDDTSSCYQFLAAGARWKSVENYVVDASNAAGLGEGFVADNMALDISKWEDAAGYNILGDGGEGEVESESIGKTANGANEVMFGDIEKEGVIGVTIIWGYFSGPKPFRELIEWDMVFDDADFAWSENAEGSSTEMDFENIATHELGHACGMGDLYTAECSAQTMYGYSHYGDIEKRTLESGDITGISSLY